MMGHVSRDDETQCKGIEGASIGLSPKAQLMICKRVIQQQGGFPDGPPFFPQIVPAAFRSARIGRPGILIKAGQGIRVQPGKSKRTISKHSFRIYDMLKHFPDGPFAFRIGMIYFLTGYLFQEFPELTRIFFQGFIDVFVFYQIDVRLIELGRDDLGTGEHS